MEPKLLVNVEVEVPRLLQTDLGQEQRCSKCGEHWPADAEFFYMRKGQPHSWCKACYVNDPHTVEKVKRYNAKLLAERGLKAPTRDTKSKQPMWSFTNLLQCLAAGTATEST